MSSSVILAGSVFETSPGETERQTAVKTLPMRLSLAWVKTRLAAFYPGQPGELVQENIDTLSMWVLFNIFNFLHLLQSTVSSLFSFHIRHLFHNLSPGFL